MGNQQLGAQDALADQSTSGSKAPGEESLAPQKIRIMGRFSYLLAWFGGCVSIGTFTMGSSIVGTLNLIQAGVIYYLLMRHWAPCQRFRH